MGVSETLAARVHVMSIVTALALIIVSSTQVRLSVCIMVAVVELLMLSSDPPRSITAPSLVLSSQVVLIRNMFSAQEEKERDRIVLMAVILCTTSLVSFPLLYALFTSHDPFGLMHAFRVSGHWCFGFAFFRNRVSLRQMHHQSFSPATHRLPPQESGSIVLCVCALVWFLLVRYVFKTYVFGKDVIEEHFRTDKRFSCCTTCWAYLLAV